MKNIRRIRQNRAFSLHDLSDHTGISKRTLEKYESGERDINGAKGIFLWRISQVLHCRIEDLLELEREKKHDSENR